MSKRNVMDQMQTIALHTFMSQHCKKGDDGFVIFEDGWDDQRMVAVFNETVNAGKQPVNYNNVSKLRLLAYGKTKVATTTSISDLAERVTKLEKDIEELAHHYDALATWMTSNVVLKANAPAKPGRPGRPQSTPPCSP